MESPISRAFRHIDAICEKKVLKKTEKFFILFAVWMPKKSPLSGASFISSVSLASPLTNHRSRNQR